MRVLAAPPPATTLPEACTALWRATLSLMVAFMKIAAPAHRYLIARRIARNLELLADQDCFSAGCRDTFTRLSRRWHLKAEKLTPAIPASPTHRPLGAGWP